MATVRHGVGCSPFGEREREWLVFGLLLMVLRGRAFYARIQLIDVGQLLLVPGKLILAVLWK